MELERGGLLDVEGSKDIRSAGFASRVGIYLARYSQCKRERGHEELGPELHVPLVPYGGNAMIANLVDVDEDRSAAQHATRLLFEFALVGYLCVGFLWPDSCGLYYYGRARARITYTYSWPRIRLSVSLAAIALP